MSRRKLLFISLTAFLICGCDFFKKITNPNDNHNQDSGRTGSFYGSLVEGKYTGFELSVSESEIKKATSGTTEIKIVGFNDFHGAVNESTNESGLKLLGSYLKKESAKENTLVFDQGDTWQGSFESNVEYGKIVQDVFYDAGVSLRTIGNHDFDWGVDRLETLCDTNANNYIPTLCANVYDYNAGLVGSTQQSQYGKEYATFVLESGVKVGVVGVIGEDQITSICSQLVQNIAFSNHNEKIKEISDFLRTEKDCDIVIASVHSGADTTLGAGLTNVSPVSKKRYVDLVLNGHTHSRRKETENGVMFAQWDSNGITAGSVTLTYDFATNSVLDNETKYDSYNKKYLNVYYGADDKISAKVDSYLASIESIGKQVLSNKFSGYFDGEILANLMCEAIYKKATSLGADIDFSVSNYARDSFEKTTLLYSDLYKCFPFDNQIILMTISGRQSALAVFGNLHYRESAFTYSYSESYRIAVIDYVGLHQNSDRNYDYFPNASNISVLTNSDGTIPTYRDILKEYILENSTKTFAAEDYYSYNTCFSI